MREKTSLKIATIPEDMLELLSQNFRLRKLLKDYLAQLLIFEVTGPENQVSTSKIRMSGRRGRKLEFLVSALPLIFCFFRFFLCLKDFDVQLFIFTQFFQLETAFTFFPLYPRTPLAPLKYIFIGVYIISLVCK